MSKQPRPLPRPLSFPLGDGTSDPVRSLLHDPALEALYLPQGREGSSTTAGDYHGEDFTVNVPFVNNVNFFSVNFMDVTAPGGGMQLSDNGGLNGSVDVDLGSPMEIVAVSLAAIINDATDASVEIYADPDGDNILAYTIDGNEIIGINNIIQFNFPPVGTYQVWRFKLTQYSTSTAYTNRVQLYQRSGRSDTLLDFTGNGNDGTLVGPTWGAYNLKFDGDDKVESGTSVGDLALPTSEISVFSYYKAGATASVQVIASKMDLDAPIKGWNLAQDASDFPTFNIRGNGVAHIVADDVAVYVGQALTVASTYDGSENSLGINLYVNGIHKDTGDDLAVVAPTTNTSKLVLGTVADTLNLTGDIYMVAIYARELSASEITVLDEFARGL